MRAALALALWALALPCFAQAPASASVCVARHRIVDAFTDQKQTLTRDELEQIEALAREMEIYPDILERPTRPRP